MSNNFNLDFWMTQLQRLMNKRDACKRTVNANYFHYDLGPGEGFKLCLSVWELLKGIDRQNKGLVEHVLKTYEDDLKFCVHKVFGSRWELRETTERNTQYFYTFCLPCYKDQTNNQ